jgi:hypothetical protein
MSHHRANRILVLFIATIVTDAAGASAQTVDPPARIEIPRVSRPPVLADFAGMDAPESALGMRTIEGFVQRFPNDGEPVSERTVAYVGYDTESLYVAFQCFDREPGRIGAHLVPRDALPNDEDSVAVLIDTFRDLKHGYGFQVNPLGVQADGTYTEGSGSDLSWDAVWRADTTVTTGGYVVLETIPFRSLRFPPTDVQEWGLFLYRGIARKNEVTFWPANSTRIAARFPQAALATGVAQVSPGRNVQAIPYTFWRSAKALDVAPDGSASFVSTRARATVGLDAKAVIRDGIVVDGTINPDFSQVESDQPQVTVNRPFELFFPEKRPFFLENATTFTTPIQLLFTRRIADPLVGARASGRVGRYTLGSMIVDDRSPFDGGASDAKAWFGVVRVTRDVGRESYVGMFLSDRALGNSRNTVAAADGRVRLGANWFGVAQVAVSDTITPTPSSARGSAISASLVGSGRHFNEELDYNDRSPAFKAMDGFIPRVDIRSVDYTSSYRARPSGGALKAWGPDLVVNRVWEYGGQPLDWATTPRLSFEWPGATTLSVFYTAAHQVFRPGEVRTVRALTDTNANRRGLTMTSAIWPRVIGAVTLSTGDAANLAPRADVAPPAGKIVDVTVTATTRLSRSLMVDTSYLIDQLREVQSRRVAYVNNIVRVRVAEQVTPALAIRTIIQYNQLAVDDQATTLPRSRNLNYDALLTFMTSPGTAVYVGANTNMADIDPRLLPTALGLLRTPALHNTGWQVFAKASYLFRP